MHSYFRAMPPLGKAPSEAHVERMQKSRRALAEIEADLEARRAARREVGLSTEAINARGALTVWQRLDYLVDPGTWHPLHSLYDPDDNPEGTTNVVDGLGKIAGRWAVIVGFDNKVSAGAWLPGQAENIHRVTDIARRLRVPLVWLVNCSGVKLPEQERFYAGRRGGGTTFFRNAELQQAGIPVIAGIYGSNPAGGGYHSISPTILLAHKDANIAVGGVAIVSGMSPKGGFDAEMLEALIAKTREMRDDPPGGMATHFEHTGFVSRVFEDETGVLDGIKETMRALPAYDPKIFRVAQPALPRFAADDLYHLVPFNQRETYVFEDVLARLVDGSEHLAFRPDYGPEVYTGLVKIDGFLVGVVANRLGLLPRGYPEYADYPGIGGKLYRQGLIKTSEFVTHCGRDRIPVLWFQDTTGIDVGDAAEKAELLGLGQTLIYSIQQTDVPMMLVVLRKGTAAAHYIMGGPTATRHNAFTLGTAATEIYVMHGETAAIAAYARRAAKDKEAGKPLEPVAETMNAMAKKYHETSRPLFCAKHGLVDEIVDLTRLRSYLEAFAGAVYQNPGSLCPPHQMILPRLIRG